MASLDYDIPLSPQSIFRTGSLSKQFTALAILLAEAQGKLNLNDKLGEHLPDLHPRVHSITLKQVIGHIGGLPDYDAADPFLKSSAGGSFRMGNEDFLTTAEFYDVTRNIQPFQPAGKGFAYSNIGYFWLGQVIEKATGQTLARFAQENIFQPAGMEMTVFNDNANAVIKNRAAGYRQLETGAYEMFDTNLDWVGDGGVYSSIEEFAKWDAQFKMPTLGADPAALRAKALEPISTSETGNSAYAAGLRLSSHETLGAQIAHSGGWVAFSTNYRHFPDAGVSYAVFCNGASVAWDSVLPKIEKALALHVAARP